MAIEIKKAGHWEKGEECSSGSGGPVVALADALNRNADVFLEVLAGGMGHGAEGLVSAAAEVPPGAAVIVIATT